MSIANKLERLLQTKNEIKAAIVGRGVLVAENEPFSSYPAKIDAIGGGGAIPLAEYDMSALQDNSVIGYVEAVPEGYMQVRIEGTGAMMDYSEMRPYNPSPLSRNSILKKIIVKEGVTSIGREAFCGCTSLTNVIIPNSVTSIGREAFCGCTSLTNVIIPNSVTTIGNGAFAECTSLTEIIIPNSVTTIGNYAFSGCSGLMEIVIPDSVTTIGDYAFSGCSGLMEIVIPDSVTTIGEFAFDNCNPDLILKPEALEKPEGWSEKWNAYDFGMAFYTVWWGGVEPTLPQWDVSRNQDESVIATLYGNRLTITGTGDMLEFTEDWENYVANETLYDGCRNDIREIVIMPGVTSIGGGVCTFLDNLERVYIPTTVATIGKFAFGGRNHELSELFISTEALEQLIDWDILWNAEWNQIGQDYLYYTVWWGSWDGTTPNLIS